MRLIGNKPWAFYNEIDTHAAAWLRELIKAGHIAPGEVDERSIEDVVPTDLMGFTQCHFFAGIGVWSYALRRAGWPDDRPVWTGSCPCQPFSAAGKGKGFADERHLWPAFFHCVSECRPVTIFGEQVGSKDVLTWLDLVQTDLEGTGYAVGTTNTPAAGYGAPHIRQRLYWVADASMQQSKQSAREGTGPDEAESGRAFGELAGCRDALRPADSTLRRQSGGVWECGQAERSTGEAGRYGSFGGVAVSGIPGLPDIADHHAEGGREGQTRPTQQDGTTDEMDNTLCNGCGTRRHHDGEYDRQQPCAALHVGGMGDTRVPGFQVCQCTAPERAGRRGQGGTTQQPSCSPCQLDNRRRPGPTNGFWRDSDWLFCRDGRWRPVESGTFPLVDGAPARVERLRGYGNAINAIQAEEFIRAYMAAEQEAWDRVRAR